jgi:hypothetical protein
VAWFENLSSVISLGGTTLLASSIYGGAVALEKTINPARKVELTKFLTSSVDHLEPPNTGEVVFTLFEDVFGKRHFSLRCFITSVIATFVVVTVIGLGIQRSHPFFSSLKQDVFGASGLYLFFFLMTGSSMVPDYISLWKGRYLLRKLAMAKSFSLAIGIIMLDIFLSALVSLAGCIIAPTIVSSIGNQIQIGEALGYVFVALVRDFKVVAGSGSPTNDWIVVLIFFLSTLFTSVWVVMVGVSATFLRSLVSVQYLAKFTRYLFDVEARPVEAIGIVVAALVWICSVVYLIV